MKNHPLAVARKKAELSQAALAEFIGCSRSFVCKMENGAKPLTPKALHFIADTNKRSTSKSTLPTLLTPLKTDTNVDLRVLKTNELQCPVSEQYTKSVTFDGESTKEWEEWWWKDYNAFCLECKNDCKQSDKVRVDVCPQHQG